MRPRGLAILAALTLSSCNKEIGPTVPATAGVGKSQAAFEVDRRGCMAMTDRALQPVANQMNAAAQSTDQLQGVTARFAQNRTLSPTHEC